MEKVRTPVEERNEEEDWMEAELKKARGGRGGSVSCRENLNLKEKKEETTVTSSGLKISNESPSRRRHHSHHHSHHRCVCERRG